MCFLKNFIRINFSHTLSLAIIAREYIIDTEDIPFRGLEEDGSPVRGIHEKTRFHIYTTYNSVSIALNPISK